MPADSTPQPVESKLIPLTIQGFPFQVEGPYKAGDVLTDIEANVINQTYAENVRNNFAATIKSMKAAVARTNGLMVKDGDKEVPDISSVSNDDLDADEVQAAFDKYVESYEFGARRAGGIRTPTDPVEREVMRTALEQVKALIIRNNMKVSSVPRERQVELAKQLIAQTPAIMENAKAFVEANKNLDLAELKI